MSCITEEYPEVDKTNLWGTVREDEESLHWTPAKQRCFVQSLAVTGSIRVSCAEARMSHRATYDLRTRANGMAFRIGWDAAILIARAHLVDGLFERAILGQRTTTQREPDCTTHHRIDNRLAMSMLTRLDRMAGRTAKEEGQDVHYAQMAAQDFEAFLDLIESAPGIEAITDFMNARDPEKIAEMQALQRCEAEAAVKAEIAARKAQERMDEEEEMSDEEAIESLVSSMTVWFDDRFEDWRTDFPPDEGFDGASIGEFDKGGYERSLTDTEIAVMVAEKAMESLAVRTAAVKARDAWFADRAEALEDDGKALLARILSGAVGENEEAG